MTVCQNPGKKSKRWGLLRRFHVYMTAKHGKMGETRKSKTVFLKGLQTKREVATLLLYIRNYL